MIVWDHFHVFLKMDFQNRYLLPSCLTNSKMCPLCLPITIAHETYRNMCIWWNKSVRLFLWYWYSYIYWIYKLKSVTIIVGLLWVIRLPLKAISHIFTPKNIAFPTVRNILSGDFTSGILITSDILSDVWVSQFIHHVSCLMSGEPCRFIYLMLHLLSFCLEWFAYYVDLPTAVSLTSSIT